MACESGVYKDPPKLTRKDLDLCELNIVYVFVLGDQGTGKTTLIDTLTTRRIYDPLLPSFQYVSESINMSDMGMITLRFLELKRFQLFLPEISQICRAAKNIFLFVYAYDDLDSLRCLYTNWIIHVKNAFGWPVTTVMLGTKVDLMNIPGFNETHHVCTNASAHCYKALFKVNYVFECSAFTGYQVGTVFCEIAKLGNKTRPLLSENFKMIKKFNSILESKNIFEEN
ncbi:hypothetical protein CDAR_408731 [Caerostris darwini]|uniref:Uncharacterized protein n=1 Tax=Caerostris darwini TaxID=1538125 RepID=A0AAV4MEU6_9ARAC|nr:hypothetical protein CDAR_408731 [Caerostris darwini]